MFQANKLCPALLSLSLLASSCIVPTERGEPGEPGDEGEIASVSRAAVTSVANINFQTAGGPIPAGYLADTGAVFGARTGGLSYGWNIDNAANARDRDSTLSADQRYDTLNHMQKTGGATVWELAIPNGSYTVHIVSGDATAFNSVYKIAAEGVLVVNGTPTTGSRWVEGTKTVTISDGRLTLTNASGASNNKICFIDVSTVDSTPTAVTVSPARLVYTEVIGGAASASQTASFTNTGSAAVTVSGASISGGAAADYAITTAPATGSLAPGASVTVRVAFNPTAVGVKKSTLNLNLSSGGPATVALRGLAVAGTGGSNEPSLQRIFDTLDIAVATGDPTPDTTDFPNPGFALAGEEVNLQSFVKAGTGPVTIESVAAFGVASTPVVRVGFYPAGMGSAKTELFTIAPSNAQQLLPPLVGTLSFDPGTATVGLYTIWPSFGNREVFTEDGLNGFEPLERRHHARVYQLKNAAGQVQPNAFIVTFEEHPASFDFNDVVFVVRNVRSASPGSTLTLVNQDGVPFDDRLVASRLLEETTGQLYHNRVKLRLHASGTAGFSVTGLTLAGPFTLVSPPTLPLSLPPGGFRELTVDLSATGGTGKILSGSLSVATSGGPGTRVVQLAGARTKAEGGNEPNLVQVVGAFGYQTAILFSGQNINQQGRVLAVGEEVLSKYWRANVVGAPVVVKQLAAYHSRPAKAAIRWFSKGSTTTNTIVTSAGLTAQTLLPLKDGSTTDLAFGSFTNGGAFGFKVDGESSDDSLNNQTKDMENGCPGPCGHHLRFWPAKDRTGEVIPGTYLMGMDYSGINYDYQDNIYLISNIRPE
jgi:hypothetical protein